MSGFVVEQIQEQMRQLKLVSRELAEPKVLRELATCRFVADVYNVLMLGPPGVGKTHLAVSLGLRAWAHHENRLEEKLKLLVQPKLLIIDEICYLPLERLGANLFFQLISRRYERGSGGGGFLRDHLGEFR